MAVKRSKKDVVVKEPFFYGNTTKSGKVSKSGTTVLFKDGVVVTLLTPSGKGTKYANELSTGLRVTNDGNFKKDENGKPMRLTAQQRSYRSGYLDAQKDSAKAYKAKKKRNGGRK